MKFFQQAIHDPDSSKTFNLQSLENILKKAPNQGYRIARLFPEYSLQALVQGMGDVYSIDYKGKLEDINTMYYEWELRGNTDHSVKIAQDVAGNDIGKGLQEFKVCFEKKYYDPNDLIKLENHQTLVVMAPPVVLNQNKFEYTVKIFGSDPNETIASSLLTKGKSTSYYGNVQPELSQRGYYKGSKNWEKHREYIYTMRSSYSISGHAASTKWIIGDTIDGKNYKYYTTEAHKDMLEYMSYSKEATLIYGRSSVNEKGVPMIQDKQGRNLIGGNGIINQIHPSCKQTYSTLTKPMLQDIIMETAERTGQKEVKIMLTTGRRGYQQFQALMEDSMKQGAVVYETRNGNKITLGGDFAEYRFGKHSVILSQNYLFDHPGIPSAKDSNGHRIESYRMLFLDMTMYDGKPNIQTFSRKGRHYVEGTLKGLGGEDGMTSGDIATAVDGSEKHVLWEIGLAMINPYSSMMLEKSII